jgi:hypothetical protein
VGYRFDPESRHEPGAVVDAAGRRPAGTGAGPGAAEAEQEIDSVLDPMRTSLA